jgi:hypothetical protein
MPRREWPLPVFGIALCDARLGENVSSHENSEKSYPFRYCSAQGGFPDENERQLNGL